MTDLSQFHYKAPYLSHDLRYWDAIISKYPSVSYEAKDIIRMQGTPGTGIFILTSGIMQVSCVLDDGTESIQHFNGPGSVYGVISLYSQKPYMSTAQAATFCRGHVIPPAAGAALLNSDNEFVRNLLFLEIERSNINYHRMLILAMTHSRDRLIAVLLGFCARIGVPAGESVHIPLRLKHHELGNIIHVDRVTVSRLLSAFIKEGALCKKDGYFEVFPERLLALYSA